MTAPSPQPSLGHKTGRNALALLACRIGADLLNFLLFLVVSRRFGPEGMGEYGYGFALAGLVYYAATLGIDEYGVREYAILSGQRRRALISNLLGAQVCIAIVVIAVLAGYLSITRPTPQMLTIIAWQTWRIDLARPEVNYRLFLANILTGVLLAGAAFGGTF